MCALYDRWDEQYHLVVEEMHRAVRQFKYDQHQCLIEAEQHEQCGRFGHATYARRYVFNVSSFRSLLTRATGPQIVFKG